MYSKDRVPLGRKNINVAVKKDTPDNFLGIGKKAKAKKAVRVAQRQEKKAVKIDARKARVEDKRSKAVSRIELAKQGKTMPTGIAAIGEAIGGLLGGQNQQQDAIDNTQLQGDITPAATGPEITVQPQALKPSQIGITPPVENTVVKEAEGTDTDYKSIAENQPARQRRQDSTNDTGTGKKDNTMLYIIIGIAAVILFFFLRKK